MRKQTDSPALLGKIKSNNEGWFSEGNRRFFHDFQYWGYYGMTSGDRFLLRSTYAWTDMFGQTPRLHYRINVITDDYGIEDMIDTEFASLDDARAWPRQN